MPLLEFLKSRLSVKAIVSNSELYSEPCQKSKKEHFVQIISDFQALTIFTKQLILDVQQGPEYASGTEYNWAKYNRRFFVLYVLEIACQWFCLLCNIDA